MARLERADTYPHAQHHARLAHGCAGRGFGTINDDVTMNSSNSLATLAFYPHENPRLRLFALWYFTILMTLWNIAGHTFLGFEQAWAHPLAAVGAACFTQFFLEWIDAKANRRAPRYAGSIGNCLNWFPPAIISGFACAMLLYPNERIW